MFENVPFFEDMHSKTQNLRRFLLLTLFRNIFFKAAFNEFGIFMKFCVFLMHHIYSDEIFLGSD
jgi:hypothetical protein